MIRRPARAVRPDAMRRSNLALVLAEIHRDGQLTRAELTARLDFSRSTIGGLVSELDELGLVQEVVPIGGVRAGRPSHQVAPRSDGPYAIAVDVDVTRTTVAAVALGGTVLRRVRLTELDHGDVIAVADSVHAAIGRLRAELDVRGWAAGVGVSVPGTVNNEDGTISFAPNLAWHDVPIGQLLADRVPDLTVRVDNDANLAVLAEHTRGSGRGTDEVVFLAGRIGVGAGIVVNGRPLRGRHGYAGEVGHNVVDRSGPRCHCGKRGCVETYLGGKALLALAGRRRAPTEEQLAAVFTAARAGNPRAGDAVRTVAGALGHVAATLANVLNPELFILGGTFADVLAIAGDEVRLALGHELMERDRDLPRLVPPGLGRDSSLLGAAEVAFDHLLADPTLGR